MFCPRCGASVDADSTFCTSCGQPIEHSANADGFAPLPSETIQIDSTSRIGKIKACLIIAIFALVVLVAALFAYSCNMLPNRNQSNSNPGIQQESTSEEQQTVSTQPDTPEPAPQPEYGETMTTPEGSEPMPQPEISEDAGQNMMGEDGSSTLAD